MKSKYDRQEFRHQAGSVGRGRRLLSKMELPLAAQAAAKPIRRPLGKSGITLPIVSMGVMNRFSGPAAPLLRSGRPPLRYGRCLSNGAQ